MDDDIIDNRDSETSSVGYKRRIAEALLQQQEEEGGGEGGEPPSTSFSIAAPLLHESKDSSLILSSPKESQEQVLQDHPSPKKAKCSSFRFDPTGEKKHVEEQELGASELNQGFSVSSVSGYTGCDNTSDDFATKIEAFALQAQETEKEHGKDCANGEVSVDCKAMDCDMISAVDENKEILVVSNGEAESLLEAKKKHLLAQLEDGFLLKEKSFSDFDGNESIRSSLKIEIIDDTAIIEPVPAPNAGNLGICNADENERKYEKRTTDGQKSKRSRRRGKGQTKVPETLERPKNMTLFGEAEAIGQKNGNRIKRKYAREEMEALRFVNIVEQRKCWANVYSGLGHAVMKEYNDLASSKHQTNFTVNFPVQPHGRSHASGILGEESSENMEIVIENVEESVSNTNVPQQSCGHDTGDEDGCPGLEGECSEEYDSDEDYASLLKPAFVVEGKPDFDSGPPEDGLEYLRRVRWEAAHIPKVTAAKIDANKVVKEQSVYMPQIPDIAKCPEHLLPLKQWEDAFLADFSQLRTLLAWDEGSSTRMSSKLESQAVVTHEEDTSFAQLNESFILEKLNKLSTDEVHCYEHMDVSSLCNTRDHIADIEDGNSQIPSAGSSPSDSSLNYPTLSTVLAMDSVARVSMLRKRISVAETMNALSKSDCVWLFALCAAVDTPLDADTSAALRGLLRKCASLRAAKSEPDDELVMLNILATIAGRYFGQAES